MMKKYRIWTDGDFFLIERGFKHKPNGTTYWESINGGKIFLSVEGVLSWTRKNNISRNDILDQLVSPSGQYMGFIDKIAERKVKLKKLFFNEYTL